MNDADLIIGVRQILLAGSLVIFLNHVVVFVVVVVKVRVGVGCFYYSPIYYLNKGLILSSTRSHMKLWYRYEYMIGVSSIVCDCCCNKVVIGLEMLLLVSLLYVCSCCIIISDWHKLLLLFSLIICSVVYWI